MIGYMYIKALSVISYEHNFAVLTVPTMQQTNILKSYAQRKHLDKIYKTFR